MTNDEAVNALSVPPIRAAADGISAQTPATTAVQNESAPSQQQHFSNGDADEAMIPNSGYDASNTTAEDLATELRHVFPEVGEELLPHVDIDIMRNRSNDDQHISGNRAVATDSLSTPESFGRIQVGASPPALPSDQLRMAIGRERPAEWASTPELGMTTNRMDFLNDPTVENNEHHRGEDHLSSSPSSLPDLVPGPPRDDDLRDISAVGADDNDNNNDPLRSQHARAHQQLVEAMRSMPSINPLPQHTYPIQLAGGVARATPLMLATTPPPFVAAINSPTNGQMRRAGPVLHGNTTNGTTLVALRALQPMPLPDPQQHLRDDEQGFLERYTCVLCASVLGDPVGCGNASCATRFGRACLTRALQDTHLCPVCRQSATVTADVELRQEMEQFGDVCCRYAACATRAPLLEIKSHEKTCPHTKVACRFRGFGCSWTGVRADVDAHEQTECHLYKVRELVQFMRLLKAHHEELIKSVRNGLVPLQQSCRETQLQLQHIRGMLTNHIRGQQLLARPALPKRLRSNPVHVVEYVCLVLQADASVHDEQWFEFGATLDARARVANVLSLVPTMLLALQTVRAGLALSFTVPDCLSWKGIGTALFDAVMVTAAIFGVAASVLYDNKSGTNWDDYDGTSKQACILSLTTIYRFIGGALQRGGAATNHRAQTLALAPFLLQTLASSSVLPCYVYGFANGLSPITTAREATQPRYRMWPCYVFVFEMLATLGMHTWGEILMIIMVTKFLRGYFNQEVTLPYRSVDLFTVVPYQWCGVGGTVCWALLTYRLQSGESLDMMQATLRAWMTLRPVVAPILLCCIGEPVVSYVVQVVPARCGQFAARQVQRGQAGDKERAMLMGLCVALLTMMIFPTWPNRPLDD